MKHLSTLVVILLIATVIVAAQTADNQKATTAKKPVPAKTVVKKEKKADTKKPVAAKTAAPAKTVAKKEAKPVDKGVPKLMGGMIVAVDAAKNTITLKFKSKNYSFSIVPQTALVAKENKISFADLKKGDYVTINYMKFKNGERKAEKVNNKTFAVKLEKMKSKSEPQAKPAQAKGVKAQPKTQQAPAQKKAVKTDPKPEAKPSQNKETKSEEKKDTKQAVK